MSDTDYRTQVELLSRELEQTKAELAELKAWLAEQPLERLRAELATWQTAFGMMKGTPQELAAWAVRDAARVKELEEAIGWHVNGFTLREYLAVQFPATVGHIPLEMHLDKLQSALASERYVKGTV